MGTETKRRTQVDAIDDLTAELRTANVLAALAMGGSALEHDAKGEQSATASTAARAKVRNALRKVAREGLGIDGEGKAL